jgi:hypothetical protein
VQQHFLSSLREELAQLQLWSPPTRSQPPDEKRRMGFLR